MGVLCGTGDERRRQRISVGVENRRILATLFGGVHQTVGGGDYLVGIAIGIEAGQRSNAKRNLPAPGLRQFSQFLLEVCRRRMRGALIGFHE